jgi:hypothetical protein
MTKLGKRLDRREERKVFEEFLESRAEFDGRSEDELDFFCAAWKLAGERD